MQKLWKVLVLFVPLLSGAKHTLAQENQNAQLDTVRELQEKLDQLKTQMNAVQSELNALRAATPPTHFEAKKNQPLPESSRTGTIENTGPPLPSIGQITPDQQHAAVGKETAEYETFAKESEPVPRLYNAPLDENYPGFFVLPGTQTMMRIDGNLKTDFTFDPRPAGVVDSFVPSTIPIPQESSPSNFNVGIRESQLSADLLFPVSDIGLARTFIQFDFFGANGATTPRLRHFYGQFKNFLIGQTNTVFMDPDAWPDIVEFQGPTSGLLARPPQFRYSFEIGRWLSSAVSVEQPNSDVAFSVAGSPSQAITPAPDVAMMLRYEGERGHLYLSTVFRKLAVHLPNGGPQESTLGWGLNFSSTWRIVGKDTLNYQVAYGNGIARYTGDAATLGLDAQPRSSTDLRLKALPVFAPWISYQHYWSRSIRSSATFGWLQVVSTEFAPQDVYHKSSYSSANVIWNPYGGLSFGAEFMYGRVQQKDGLTSNAPRLQFSGRYTFVKLHQE
jgi:outer membrane DcaP-like protein